MYLLAPVFQTTSHVLESMILDVVVQELVSGKHKYAMELYTVLMDQMKLTVVRI